MKHPIVLAADVGGTKTNLALVSAPSRGEIGAVAAQATYRSEDYPSLESMADEFRAAFPSASGPIAAATVGFAGPIADGRGLGTNVSWSVDARALARHLSLPHVGLINDLVATGYGVPTLRSDALAPLLTGDAAPDGNAAVIAAGTGLGETILARIDGDLIPVASEGGHADFAPRTDVELEIWEAMRTRFGRVSIERVLSGPGLANVAEVLHARSDAAAAWAAHGREAGTPDGLPGIVSARALDRSCAACAEALETFAGIYGSEAGNLALIGLARSGVYLGGGIAPRILPALGTPIFANAFRDKEPHRALLSRIPVQVILDDKAALWGAARHASLSLT